MAPLLNRLRRRTWILIAIVVALGGLYLALPGSGSRTVVAYFANSEGIYVGDNVSVLGVPVGTITGIKAVDGQVRVTMNVDSDIKIPAGAQAAIVAPSLVSSRYVQLAPRYQSGPTLADGGVIPRSRTYVPVEWDQIKDELNRLAVALGPQGANRDGSLSNLVRSAKTTFAGEGVTFANTLTNLSKAVGALNNSSGDIVSTIQNLQIFVTALRESDQQIATFTTRLDAVSSLIDDNGSGLRTAVANLASAVGKVESFVKTNKAQLLTSASGLAAVTKIVAAQQENLAQTLHVAPNAISNLIAAVHRRQNAVGVDLQGANIHSPGQLLCGAIGGASAKPAPQAGELCQQLLGGLLDQLASNGQTTKYIQLLEQLLGIR
jgi:phospholipid/cholesterol/gamma-HCH transport system substrate-binding protein